jgi:hypothetical protein
MTKDELISALKQGEEFESFYGGGDYVAIVAQNEDGYTISYYKTTEEMPPHKVDDFETAEETYTVMVEWSANWCKVEYEAEDYSDVQRNA